MSEWSIDDGEVHVWRARLDRPERDVEEAAAVLSADELERAARGSSVVRRRRILSRAALRHTLAGYLGVGPDAVSFTYGAFGKPQLHEGASPPGLHFNLSRSDDYCLIGVSRSELGVDVERLEPRTDLDELAGRYFAPAESETIRRLEGESKIRAFFRCWTCKEAVLKALGSGLAGGSLARFTVSLEDEEEPSVTSFDQDPRAWRLAMPPVEGAFLAAVALRDGARTGPLVRQREPSGGGWFSAEAAITCLVRLTQET
jgi:4'-phosphopantetheinyl transferase